MNEANNFWEYGATKPNPRLLFVSKLVLGTALLISLDDVKSQAASTPMASFSKASSVTICKGQYCETSGRIAVGVGDLKASPAGPINVWIWRDLSPEQAARAQKIGVTTGKAYRMVREGKFEHITDVDLNLSDKQLIALFGVKAK